MPPRLAGIIHAREREDLFPVYAHFRLLYADPNMEIKGESPSWEWVYDDIYYSVELSPRGSRQTCQYRIVRVAQKLATIPKLETERVHPYYFFERGFEEECGRWGRGRGQCSHRHFMKIAPPVPAAPSVQPKYVTPISRLIVVILFRIHAPLHAGCLEMIVLFFPDPDSLSSDCLWRCLHRIMKNSWKNIVIWKW